MPVLSKADLFREISLPASDEIKKQFSPNVKNILRNDLGIEPHFIRNLERAVNNTPNSFKEKLRRQFKDSDLMVVPSKKGKYMHFPEKYGKNHPTHAGEYKPKVMDNDSLIVAINGYIDVFEGILEEVSKIPLEMKLRVLEGQLENPDSIREYVSDGVADLLIESPRTYDQIDTATRTLKVFLKRIKRNIKPEKESFVGFNKALKKAIKEYSISDLKENWHGSYSEFANAFGFSSQKTVNVFLKNYEDGKLAVETLAILNEEFDGKEGIEIFKEMLKEVGMKTRSFKFTEETKVQDYFNISLSKLLKEIEKASNPSAGFGEIKYFFRLKENTFLDYGETVEMRLLDLLDDKEEVEYYYNVTPDTNEEDKQGIADLKDETYQAEIKVTTRQYAFMYYIGKLRDLKLDSSLLTNDISDDYSEDKLEEKFKYVKEAFEEMGEKE
tara:strand:+ start:4988 stop:6310 length:1323 start_codon:yes stop_codon:yes gene_type:complete